MKTELPMPGTNSPRGLAPRGSGRRRRGIRARQRRGSEAGTRGSSVQ